MNPIHRVVLAAGLSFCVAGASWAGAAPATPSIEGTWLGTLQVPAKQNLPTIDQALRDAGNRRVTIKELPSLNHLFQTAKTGAFDEYARIEETVSPLALETIAGWIAGQTR